MTISLTNYNEIVNDELIAKMTPQMKEIVEIFKSTIEDYLRFPILQQEFEEGISEHLQLVNEFYTIILKEIPLNVTNKNKENYTIKEPVRTNKKDSAHQSNKVCETTKKKIQSLNENQENQIESKQKSGTHQSNFGDVMSSLKKNNDNSIINKVKEFKKKNPNLNNDLLIQLIIEQRTQESGLSNSQIWNIAGCKHTCFNKYRFGLELGGFVPTDWISPNLK